MEVKPGFSPIIRSRSSRGANWTEREKIILVQTILQHENELFGKNFSRGCPSKQKNWHEVCEAVNGELQIYRTVKQIRKTYDNLKAKAKHKLDEARRIQMCGGVAPVVTEMSIKMLMDHLEGKQSDCLSPLPLPAGCLSPLQLPTAEESRDQERSWPTSSGDCLNGESTLNRESLLKRESLQNEESLLNGASMLNGESLLDGESLPSDQESAVDHQDNCDSYQDQLLALETEKVRVEIKKLKKETELVMRRKQQEEEIFQLKKQVLLAKLKQYSSTGCSHRS